MRVPQLRNHNNQQYVHSQQLYSPSIYPTPTSFSSSLGSLTSPPSSPCSTLDSASASAATLPFASIDSILQSCSIPSTVNNSPGGDKNQTLPPPSSPICQQRLTLSPHELSRLQPTLDMEPTGSPRSTSPTSLDAILSNYHAIELESLKKNSQIPSSLSSSTQSPIFPLQLPPCSSLTAMEPCSIPTTPVTPAAHSTIAKQNAPATAENPILGTKSPNQMPSALSVASSEIRTPYRTRSSTTGSGSSRTPVLNQPHSYLQSKVPKSNEEDCDIQTAPIKDDSYSDACSPMSERLDRRRRQKAASARRCRLRREVDSTILDATLRRQNAHLADLEAIATELRSRIVTESSKICSLKTGLTTNSKVHNERKLKSSTQASTQRRSISSRKNPQRKIKKIAPETSVKRINSSSFNHSPLHSTSIEFVGPLHLDQIDDASNQNSVSHGHVKVQPGLNPYIDRRKQTKKRERSQKWADAPEGQLEKRKKWSTSDDEDGKTARLLKKRRTPRQGRDHSHENVSHSNEDSVCFPKGGAEHDEVVKLPSSPLSVIPPSASPAIGSASNPARPIQRLHPFSCPPSEQMKLSLHSTVQPVMSKTQHDMLYSSSDKKGPPASPFEVTSAGASTVVAGCQGRSAEVEMEILMDVLQAIDVPKESDAGTFIDDILCPDVECNGEEDFIDEFYTNFATVPVPMDRFNEIIQSL